MSMVAGTFDCAFSQVPSSTNNVVRQAQPLKDDILSFEDQKPLPQPSIGGLIVRVTGILAVIIFCIIALVWVLKIILQDRSAFFSKKERYFEVIDRMYLDHKRMVYLIKVVDEILVVGGANENLTLLSKITDSQKVTALSGKEFLPMLKLFHKKIDQEKGQENG